MSKAFSKYIKIEGVLSNFGCYCTLSLAPKNHSSNHAAVRAISMSRPEERGKAGAELNRYGWMGMPPAFCGGVMYIYIYICIYIYNAYDYTCKCHSLGKGFINSFAETDRYYYIYYYPTMIFHISTIHSLKSLCLMVNSRGLIYLSGRQVAVPGEWGRSTQEVAWYSYRMVDVEYPLVN